MARLPRSLRVFPNHSVHKVWRGHNREPNLGTDHAKEKYLEFLNSDLESERYESGAVLQALTLMSNHTHEVFHLCDPKLFSNHMRRHHSRYGSYFNRLSDRCGKVAQDRPHTTLLADKHHEMIAVFYIHANPLRAKMVRDMRNYKFSSHKLYAFGIREPWMRNIQLPRWYLELGKTMSQRQREYRRLFARYLSQFVTKKKFLRENFFGPILWKRKLELRLVKWRRQHAPPI